jgi:hypothetical protein
MYQAEVVEVVLALAGIENMVTNQGAPETFHDHLFELARILNLGVGEWLPTGLA